MQTNKPEPELHVEASIKRILTKEILGATMVMVNNLYENVGKAEFEDFLFDYSKRRHKYEPGIVYLILEKY